MNHKMRLHRNSEHMGSDVASFCVFDGPFPVLQAHSSDRPRNNLLPDHLQVAKGQQFYELSGVLHQAFVPHLGETKLTLEYSEGKFDLGSDTGLELFDLIKQVAPPRILTQYAALAVAFLSSLVSGLTKGPVFLTGQRSTGLEAGCTDDSVYKFGVSISPNVGLQPSNDAGLPQHRWCQHQGMGGLDQIKQPRRGDKQFISWSTTHFRVSFVTSANQ